MIDGEEEVDLFEESVGITNFANNADGFSGILKQRFSDFVVREVGLDGKVSSLISLSGKELQSKYFGNDLEENKNINNGADKIDLLFEAIKSLNNGAAFHSLDTEKLRIFINLCLTKAESCPSDFCAFPDLDKVTRTAVHNALKFHFSDVLETETTQENNISMIKINAKHKQKSKRKRSEWPSGLGNFLRFTLLKENIDTMSAVSILNKSLHCMNSTGVEYSGTKDKRGITAQKCTVYRKKPSDFDRINSSNMLPTICVGDFEYVKESAKLGDLGGNRFELVLRALSSEKNNELDVLASCAAMKQSGFINYFGLQRFGKGGTKSHDIGRAILKSDWQGCVRMLFTPREGDRENIAHAKRLFAEGKYTNAMHALPEQMFAEKCVLRRLVELQAKAEKTERKEEEDGGDSNSKHSENKVSDSDSNSGCVTVNIDWLQAYNAVSKNTRLICAHACQSYLWNKAASYRVSLYGVQNVVEGDLVATFDNDHSDGTFTTNKEVEVEKSSGDITSDNYTTCCNSNNNDNSFQRSKRSNNNSSSLNSTGDSGNNNNNKDDKDNYPHSTIHVVTAAEAESSKYSISQVVLPLPGYDVKLPMNDVGSYYTELLAMDGLTLQSYRNCNITYQMSGAYRRLLQFPKDFQWSMLTYEDPNEELHTTELNQFRVVTGNKNDNGCDAVASSSSTDVVGNDTTSDINNTNPATAAVDGNSCNASSDKRYKALQIEFTLPPGTYATMLLRELTKQSTETKFQAKLSKDSLSM